MPDDDRPRRRLGDETKNRIADLASGWSLDGGDEVPPAPVPAHTPTPKPKPVAPSGPATASPSGPARAKPRTSPPPPPGSAERTALEDKRVEAVRPGGAKTSTRANPVIGEARAKPPSTPPRSGPITAPTSTARSGPIPASTPHPGTRSGPQFRRAGYDGPSAPFSTEAHTPAVIVDDSMPVDPEPPPPLALPPRQPAPPAMPQSRAGATPGRLDSAKLAVPVGEFDSGVQTIETLERDSADALQIPEKITPVEELLEDDESPRGDATVIDPLTAKFERGDPTTLGGPGDAPDATQIEAPSRRLSSLSGGTLRPSAALRRKRGLAGDVRYVFTALFGVRESRRELATLEHRQGLRQTSRRRHLVTLGRTAVITDAFDHPALGKAREQLQAIEDERSRHAGAVSASDAELERVRRDRDAKAKQYVADHGAADAELADMAKKLEPLEKEATIARKRGQELKDSLARINRKIADTEALLDSVKAEKMDKTAILADIATLKADRQSVTRDEPVIAAELDALNPRIAAIEGARSELRRKRAELEKAEREDQRRTAELLEAIGAKRKVVERAAADAETARDTALFELGERLYVDRPKTLAAQLSPIDQIDLELGEGDRRAMELKEILSNVDKAKLARGLAMIILALAVGGSIVAWLMYMLL